MEINFKTTKLEKLLTNERKLFRKYGQRNGELILDRLNRLAIEENLNDIPTEPPERCHKLKNDRKGEFAVDILHPYRLIFEPDHNPVPTKDDGGGIDTEAVTAITIIEIVDYH